MKFHLFAPAAVTPAFVISLPASTLSRAAVSLLLAAALVGSAFAHGHYAAGVLDSNGNGAPDFGESLQLVNAPPAGAVFHLVFRPEGQRYGGFFSLDEQPRAEFSEDYFSFTALSDGHALVEEPGHAANGADIWMEITSVVGPDGGSLGFWESQWSFSHSTPTVSLAANAETGGFKFQLSEPLWPEPDGDPYGHVHNRGWTVDVPGEYTIGFTLYDLSSAGSDGGPIHAPSQTYYFTFLAVPEPSTVWLLAVAMAVLWVAMRRRKKEVPADERRV